MQTPNACLPHQASAQNQCWKVSGSDLQRALARGRPVDVGQQHVGRELPGKDLNYGLAQSRGFRGLATGVICNTTSPKLNCRNLFGFCGASPPGVSGEQGLADSVDSNRGPNPKPQTLFWPWRFALSERQRGFFLKSGLGCRL